MSGISTSGEDKVLLNVPWLACWHPPALGIRHRPKRLKLPLSASAAEAQHSCRDLMEMHKTVGDELTGDDIPVHLLQQFMARLQEFMHLVSATVRPGTHLIFRTTATPRCDVMSYMLLLTAAYRGGDAGKILSVGKARVLISRGVAAGTAVALAAVDSASTTGMWAATGRW